MFIVIRIIIWFSFYFKHYFISKLLLGKYENFIKKDYNPIDLKNKFYPHYFSYTLFFILVLSLFSILVLLNQPKPYGIIMLNISNILIMLVFFTFIFNFITIYNLKIKLTKKTLFKSFKISLIMGLMLFLASMINLVIFGLVFISIFLFQFGYGL